MGPFPKGKQPENPKTELMSGHSSRKDMKPKSKNIPIQNAPTTPEARKSQKTTQKLVDSILCLCVRAIRAHFC